MCKKTRRTSYAMEVLEAGGYFREQLEMNSYTKRSQFETRLCTASGAVVYGISTKTQAKLVESGVQLWLKDSVPGVKKLGLNRSYPTAAQAKEQLQSLQNM